MLNFHISQVDGLEKEASSFEEELENLRLKHDEVAVGFRLFEISTSKQLTVSMAFDITAAIAAYYFSFSAFLDGKATTLGKRKRMCERVR